MPANDWARLGRGIVSCQGTGRQNAWHEQNSKLERCMTLHSGCSILRTPLLGKATFQQGGHTRVSSLSLSKEPPPPPPTTHTHTHTRVRARLHFNACLATALIRPPFPKMHSCWCSLQPANDRPLRTNGSIVASEEAWLRRAGEPLCEQGGGRAHYAVCKMKNDRARARVRGGGGGG